MISEVIRFQGNDMVLVFDEQGEQMVEYQGRYQDARSKYWPELRRKRSFITAF